MTRRRAAIVLSLALAWLIASPCLSPREGPAERGLIIGAAARAEAVAAWLPRAAAEQLARLPEDDAGRVAPRAMPQRCGERPAAVRRPGAPPPRRVARRAPWRRRARATDEPS